METQIIHKTLGTVSTETTGDGIASNSMSEFLRTIQRQKWKIAVFLLLCGAVTAVILARIRPLFEATAKLEVIHPGGAGVIGPEALPNSDPVSDMDQILTTRMQEIQSESVLRPIVDRFDLLKEEGQTKPPQPAREHTAIVLSHLQIRRPPNSYVIDISYRAHDPKLAAAVSNSIANAYVRRSILLQVKSSTDRADVMELQAMELRKKMLQSQTSLASFENTLGILDPEQRTTLLTTRLGQLTTDLTTAQDEQSRKEAATAAVQNNTIASAQSTAQGAALAHVQERLNDAQQRFAQIKAIYGSDHPEYQKAQSEVQELAAQLKAGRLNTEQQVESTYAQSSQHAQNLERLISKTKAEMNGLSGIRHRYEQMKRDAATDEQLYSQMMLRIKEYEINASYRNSMVRVIDPAMPPAIAVFPKKALLIGSAALASLVLAVLGAVLIDKFDNTLIEPEQTARALKVEVLGVLPELKNEAARTLLNPSWDLPDEAASGPISQYQEAIRVVRNSISLADLRPQTKSILFTSAHKGEGKSTTLAHLARATAAQGKRILLVDADLRQPVLHRRVNLAAEPTLGLSGALEGQYPWRSAVVPLPSDSRISLLPAGVLPKRNAADLIDHGIAAIIKEASREYDLVLVDSPPVFGFPETLQICVVVDAVILVARASHTAGGDVLTAISTLERFRNNLLGVILNRVGRQVKYHSYGYEYRNYYGIQPVHGQKQLTAQESK